MGAAGCQPEEVLEKIREMRPLTADEVEKKRLDHQGEMIFTGLQEQESRRASGCRSWTDKMLLSAEQEDHSDGSVAEDSHILGPDEDALVISASVTPWTV